MTQFLPDTLLVLFAARPPIEYKSPPDDLLINRKRVPIGGIAEYVGLFERTEKQELLAYKLEQGIAMWSPAENPKATVDPYKTLFVARINYETSESKLRREFEKFGKILKIVMPTDKNGKPRGYAFVEYSHKSEMSAAYKKADGMKIDGRRVVVDYERGRTQKTWLPRRLGGGKGDTRRTREAKTTHTENGGSGSSPYRSSNRRSRSRERISRDDRDQSSRDDRDRDRGRDDRGRDDRGRDDRRERDRDRDRDDRRTERDRSRR